MTKIYLPLTHPRYNELRVNVDYTLGGINYFSGSSSPRGYYLYLTPVTHANGMISCQLLGEPYNSGFKVLLETANRLNRKRLAELQTKVYELANASADTINALWGEQNWTDISALLNPANNPKAL